MNMNEKLGNIYLKMGVCKTDSLKYDTAIVYYGLGQYYSFVYDDKKTQKLCLYNLANNYKKTNEVDLALETVEKCLAFCDETEDYELYIFSQGIKATCYEAKEDYDRAIEIYKSILEKIPDNESIFLGYAYNNIGVAYSAKNDFKESLKYFEMAEKFRNEVDKINLGVTLIEKSNVFLKQNLYTDAISIINLGINYAIEYNNMEYLLKGNYLLANIYDKINDLVNLENIYLKTVELLKINNDKNSLKSIYDKIALMYCKQGKSIPCGNYLVLSNDLN